MAAISEYFSLDVVEVLIRIEELFPGIGEPAKVAMRHVVSQATGVRMLWAPWRGEDYSFLRDYPKGYHEAESSALTDDGLDILHGCPSLDETISSLSSLAIN